MGTHGRLWYELTLTNTGGSVSHTDQNGKTQTRIYIGRVEDVSVHIFGINGHTIQLWGTNESKPADASNAIQLGTDITADGLVVIEDGPMWLFIETGTAGTGTPTAIVTGRDRV
jgi:hypothetical protein